MELSIADQLFVVAGAGAGLGHATAEALLADGAHVIGVARHTDSLQPLQARYPQQLTVLSADITQPATWQLLQQCMGSRQLHGVLVNAGGPPAATALEATLQQWDEAYQQVLRWKIGWLQTVLPAMQQAGYGRILFIESASVKQPMENLVLSNSLRLAVVGYAKTLAGELAPQGITVNVLAPGFHATAAMERLFSKKMEQQHINRDAAMAQYVQQTPVGFMGQAADFGSLACWLLSPHSRFITGQTIAVDGGVIKGTF
ncbi:MAG: SDR family oxidoreductase [Chitinophagaceae bacterium]|nr:SDR family oxidoreductase [Chitinophagaceae bacterium]